MELEANITKGKKTLHSVLLVQSAFRRNKWKRLFNQMIRRYRYRVCVVRELVNSEEAYVKDIQLIMEKIHAPLESILNAQEMETLFSNLKTILQLN